MNNVPATEADLTHRLCSLVTPEAVTGSDALDTKLDAAFGILGASLILSGLVLATAGAAYKR